MPYSITVPLKTIRSLPEEAGNVYRALNALLYRWLKAAESPLADFVHDEAEPKPFTLSPLIADGEERYHFRVTLLEDEYGPFVSNGMEQERTLRIGTRILEIDGNADVEHRPYADIVEQAGTSPLIVLRFESPTSRRIGFPPPDKHHIDDPLPEPRTLFASYLKGWQAFSGQPIEPAEALLDWVEQFVAVSRFDIRSEVLKFETYSQIGCVGQVAYTVIRRDREDVQAIRLLNMLADYAWFCGTGHKTTQGMGQTRRLERWPHTH